MRREIPGPRPQQFGVVSLNKLFLFFYNTVNKIFILCFLRLPNRFKADLV